MVKWASKERALDSRIRRAEGMTKRRSPSGCSICGRTIAPGDRCFFYEANVKGLQYPVRRYVCSGCHGEETGREAVVKT